MHSRVESARVRLPASEIDASCRWPLLLLFTSAAFWLVLGTGLSLIVAIKLHAPGFLADRAWLTLGRLRPVAMNAFLFGFASQAGMGLALWQFCRLGGNKLMFQWPLIVAGKLWNLALAVGLLAILAGETTGFEWLEMPRYAAGLLFVAYALFGVCAVAAFALRREREVYPSQWFLLAALFWFPWLYSAANYLLVLDPVRGTFQAAVSAWYSGGFANEWLTPIGLAGIYYFLPRLTGQPLASREMAAFSFWTLTFFGGFAGWATLNETPVPRWMGSVGTAATGCLLVPLLTNAINWYSTNAGNRDAWKKDDVLRFVLFGAVCYLAHGVVNMLCAHPLLGGVVDLTYAGVGRTSLWLHGFVSMVLFGGLYYILPRLVQISWPKPAWIRLHFLCSAIGVGLLFLSLTLAGVVQGLKLADASVPFLAIVRGTVPFIGLSTLGVLALLVGQVAFLVNLSLLLRRFLEPLYRALRAACCEVTASDIDVVDAAAGSLRGASAVKSGRAP